MDSAAETLRDLPAHYHVLFDLVHFTLCVQVGVLCRHCTLNTVVQGERADMGEGHHTTSRQHPLACWLAAMLSCFAGGILVAPLCGEPPLAALGDPLKLGLATLVWLLLNYCPQVRGCGAVSAV